MIPKLSFNAHEINAICLDEHSPLHTTFCHECLAKQLKSWMRDKPEKIKQIIESELEKFEGVEINGKECIICKKHKIISCPYCFIDILYEKLKEKTKNKDILHSFLELV